MSKTPARVDNHITITNPNKSDQCLYSPITPIFRQCIDVSTIYVTVRNLSAPLIYTAY